jgi:hypothetical protein
MSNNQRGGHGESAATAESKEIENNLREAVLRIRCEISNRFIIPVGDIDFPKKGCLIDAKTNKVVKKFANSGKETFVNKYFDWIKLNPSIIITNCDDVENYITNYKKPFKFDVEFFEKGGPECTLKYVDPLDYSACQPDGGFFCIRKDDKLIPIVASETKHQGQQGNAIERFFDNNIWSRDVNPNISYMTFASGEGASLNEVIHRTLYKRHHGKYGGFSDYFPGRNSCFMSVDGFTKGFIYDKLIKAIIERCKFYEL